MLACSEEHTTTTSCTRGDYSRLMVLESVHQYALIINYFGGSLLLEMTHKTIIELPRKFAGEILLWISSDVCLSQSLKY